jgi:hypothetical protein
LRKRRISHGRTRPPRPFEPFAINLSSGESHEIRHPECLAIGKTRVYVSYPEEDRFVICSMLHVTSVELLQRA